MFFVRSILCEKGQFAYDFVQHPDRLSTPLERGNYGRSDEASRDDTLDHAAAANRNASDEHRRHAVNGIASG